MIKDNYKIINLIGAGSFCEVYNGIDKKSKENIVLKVENKNNINSTIKREYKIYKLIGNKIKGIPKLYTYINTEKYNILILENAGISLTDFMDNNNTIKLDEKLVNKIFLQLLSILEKLHSLNILHKDIKPSNITIKNNKFYLIDFNLSNKAKTECIKHSSLTGTKRYSSIDVYNGYENSYKDDLENLIYVCLYLIRGNLPWQTNYKNKINKETFNINDIDILCKDYIKYKETLKYCLNLKFNDRINFNFIRDIFNKK